MPWKLGKRNGEIVVVRESDNKVVGRHKSRKKAVAQLRALYAIEKAKSFGGDRSAAGRYAAEQRWKGHVKADAKGSGGGRRTVDEKLRDGPVTLSFGRDANGLPKVGSLEELAARYGVKPNATTSKELAPLIAYFKEKYGEYGLEMLFPSLLDRTTADGKINGLPIFLAGCQALEDVLDNLDLEGIGTAIADAKAANERIKPIEGSTSVAADMSKVQALPVVKFTMNKDPNGDFTWNGEAQDQLRLHSAAIVESTMSALFVLATTKLPNYDGNDKELSYQTSTLFAAQSEEALGLSDEAFRSAQMRRAYATMVHELGHFLDYRLGPKGVKVGDLYQRQRARETAGTPTFDQSATGYGRVNPNESVAETFASWFLFSQARFPKERADAISRVTQQVQQDNEKMAKPFLTRAEMIKEAMRSMIAVTPNDLPLNHPVTLFTVFPFLNKIGELRAGIEKARSFGGDRSEAGRYAANIRWQSHVKQETNAERWSARTEGGKDLVRLAHGTGRTTHGEAFLEPTLWIGDGEKPMSWRKQKGPVELAEVVTAADAIKVYETHPHLADDVNLQMQLEKLRKLSPDTKVRLALEVDYRLRRTAGAGPVRPDEPHDVQDITVLESETPWNQPMLRRGEIGLSLTVNTSPANVRDVSKSLRRWEEPVEGDPLEMPYVPLIAKFAAAMSGDAPRPEDPWAGRDFGYKPVHPSMTMLERDAKVLLQTLRDNPAEQPVLWRGFKATSEAKQMVADAEVGDTFRMGLASTSRDFRAAAKYSRVQEGDTDIPVVMRIEAGSKGIQFGDSALYTQDQEVVTGGEFVVVDRELVTIPKGAMRWNPFGTVANWSGDHAKAYRAAVDQFKTVLSPKQYKAAAEKADREVARGEKLDAEMIEVEVMTVRQVATYDPTKRRWNPNG